MSSVSKKRSGSAEEDIFDEVLSGIKIYFNRSLGKILLYRFERQQFLDLKKAKPDEDPSNIYGAEHLLRLFGMSFLDVVMCFELISTPFSFSTRPDFSDQHGSAKRRCTTEIH